ncbi:hypothetical protein [Pseudarthrobacter sulfonivorans]|uniref:hypothetical protein n=1 Tax=Pseudarthrobacter sulfonivorans TaxID=121292 RepID=UPI002107A288|nr:hypothetical protein [Pseudarthrobacter sulfonivorans]
MRAHHAPPPFHLLRAASLSTGILTLAAAAHVLGGGDLPAPEILLAVLALSVLAATTATRLKLNFAAMTAVLGAGQFALHQVFTVFSAPVVASHPAPATHHLSAAAFPVLDAAAHVHASPTSILMLAAHALATAACALLLAKGEAALWALAAWLKPLSRLPEAIAPDAGTPRAAPHTPAVLPHRPWRNLRQDSRRGPPSAVVLS